LPWIDFDQLRMKIIERIVEFSGEKRNQEKSTGDW
jgi:hypothetical protein